MNLCLWRGMRAGGALMPRSPCFDPGRSSGARPSVRMSRRWAALGCAVAITAAVAGCGSTGSPSGTTASTSPTVVLTPAQLDDALLTVADLPSGWELHDSTTDTTELTFGMGQDNSSSWCPAGTAALRTETHGVAEVIFTQSDSNSGLTQALGSAPDAGVHFADIEQAFSSCVGQTWKTDAGGASLTWTMAETSDPTIADESASYQVTLTVTNANRNVSGSVKATLVRRSSVVELYSYSPNPMVTMGELSSEDFTAIVTTGDRKVADELDKIGSTGPGGGSNTTSAAAAPMTKAAFVAEANGICKATKDQVGELFKSDPKGQSEDLRVYLMRIGPRATPLLRSMLAELRTLTPPASDEAAIERGRNEMRALINHLDVDPTWMFNQMFPKDIELYDYGLTECFVDHVDVL